MPPLHVAAMLLVVLVWGLNHLAVKIGVADCPPMLFASVRLFVVAAALLPFCTLPRGAWGSLLWISFWFGTASLGLSSFSLIGIDAATSAIVVNLGTPFTILAGRIAFGETFGWWRWGGVGVSFVGVALLAGEPTNVAPIYFAAAVISIVCWAVANVRIKQLHQLSAVTVNGWVSLMAAGQLAVGSALFESNQISTLTASELPFWGALLFAALGSSVVGHTLWNWLLHRHPINTVTPYNLLVPVVGFAAALVFLNEPLTWQKATGGALALAGVAVIQVRELIVARRVAAA
ncbi:MAG: EamA/RhaT family transporter [Alphaproteobacteria bacterium]|nr:EamA/RhaT family transporter [Alphaproteobacteria bacterium]